MASGGGGGGMGRGGRGLALLQALSQKKKEEEMNIAREEKLAETKEQVMGTRSRLAEHLQSRSRQASAENRDTGLSALMRPRQPSAEVQELARPTPSLASNVQIKKTPSPPLVPAPAVTTTAAPALPAGRGSGRGSIIASLLSKQQQIGPGSAVPPSKPQPVITSGATVIRQSEAQSVSSIASSAFQRISPLQEVARNASPPRLTRVSPEVSFIQAQKERSPMQPVITKTLEEKLVSMPPIVPPKPIEESTPLQPTHRPLLGPRGRGVLLGRMPSLSKAPEGTSRVSPPVTVPVPVPVIPAPVQAPVHVIQAPAQISPPTIVSTSSEAAAQHASKQLSQPKPVTSSQIDEALVKKKIEKAATSSTSGVSGGQEAPQKTSLATSAESRSQYVSVVTTSSKSIEKAMEELKVEHILRHSPVRKVGEAGTMSNFSTNYIKLKCMNKGLYQYVVQYEPPIDSQHQRIKYLYYLSEVTGNVRLFDGYTLFLPICLKDKITEVKVKRRNDENEITMKIIMTKILPPEQIPATVFNIIFKNIMKELKMNRIGQHYFSPLRQIEVPNHNLQIWPGYTTAVHEYEDGLYLVIDVAHKILRSQTCWHLMNTLHQRCRDPSTFRDQVFNELIGNIVLTRYNNKTYRIDDILWEENPRSTFSYGRDGEMISYIDYYKKHYGIEIKDLDQPLLLNRAKKSKQELAKQTGNNGQSKTDIICLIPELCFLTGLSNEVKTDIHVKKDLATHTRLTPKQRCDQLRDLIENIRRSPDALKQITNWGLELDTDLANLEGRTLPREKIMFGRREVETDNKCDWTRACGNEEVLKAVDIKQWMVVYPISKEQVVERFASLACDSGRRIGIRLAAIPVTVPLRDDKPDTYYNEIKKHLNEHIQVVVIIFPMLSDSRYMRVKRLLCIERPVPSQVILLKTISKPDNVLKTVAQKIILQMNVKLGGELWRLSIPIKKMMIVGIDIYHKIEKKYKSIAGFVSSLNHDQTRWYSKVCFQMVGQELTDSLKIAFTQALRKYQEVNNYLPEKIFIYRDGVSEGQLSVVSDHEVAQLRSCFAADYSPQMSVIVVQKRISTRVFSLMNREQGNPIPGAVVDHTITSKDHFDFFLVSQHVGQGTVTPTHYIVAYDNTQLKPDHIQRLSYKMTHMYYNWTGTIRVPAPCQYAHKLAFLTGQYLQEEANEGLADRLFYL